MRSEEHAMPEGSEDTRVAVLRVYQDACNAFEIERCVALFTEDGVIDDRGLVTRGREAIRAAHEYDRAVGARIALDDFRAAEDAITCRFVYAKELDRILGLGGLHQTARFTFRDGRIREFAILAPDAAELRRHLRCKGPFFEWAKRAHPDLYARSRDFDAAGGAALRWLGEAWIRAGRPMNAEVSR